MRPRASRWEWAQAGLLAGNLAWTTLCLGGYRPETMMVTLALTGALLAVHCASRALEPTTAPLHPAGFWPLPFLAYAAANVLWVTPVPWLGWIDWLGWAQLVAVFWVVVNGIRSRGPRQVLFLALALLGVVAVLMACHQRFGNPRWLMLGRVQAEQFAGRASGPFGIPNSLAGFFLLLLPAAGALAFRRSASAAQRVWWGWLTAVFMLGLLLTVSRGAWLALVVALTAWALTSRRLSWKKRVGLSAVVLVAMLLVSVAIGWFSTGGRARFVRLVEDGGERSRAVLWRGAWELFREQPIFGAGAGSFNVRFEQHRPARFLDEPQWAHNDYLNTLSDYGAVGFGLFFGAIGAMLWRGRRRKEPERRRSDWLAALHATGALRIGLLAFALQLFVEFHFKIPALALAFALMLAMAIEPRAANPVEPTRKVPARNLAWLAAAALVVAALFPVVTFYRAEALRYRARQAIDAQVARARTDLGKMLPTGQADLQRATALYAGNGQAWGDLALAYELQAFVTPARSIELGKAAEQAARRALGCSEAVAEFWIRLGVALDMQQKRAEARPAFEAATKLAPRNFRTWYYYAFHLSLDPTQRTAAREAIANCLALDPGSGQAESLRVQLNERP